MFLPRSQHVEAYERALSRCHQSLYRAHLHASALDRLQEADELLEMAGYLAHYLETLVGSPPGRRPHGQMRLTDVPRVSPYGERPEQL